MQVGRRLFKRGRLVDRLQVGHKRLAVFPGNIAQAVSYLVNDAALDLGLRKDRLNRLLEPDQAIDAGDEDILNAANLQVINHAQPEVGPFRAVPYPMPEYLSLIHISEPTRLDARSRMPASA